MADEKEKKEAEKKARAEEIAQLKSDIEAVGKKRDAVKTEYEKESDPILKEDLRLNVVMLVREIGRMKKDLETLENGQKDGHPPKRRVRSIFG